MANSWRVEKLGDPRSDVALHINENCLADVNTIPAKGTNNLFGSIVRLFSLTLSSLMGLRGSFSTEYHLACSKCPPSPSTIQSTPLSNNMNRTFLLLLLVAFCSLASQAKIQEPKSQVHRHSAHSRRRKLQHRKLRWAPDDAAIADQYIVVFSSTLNKEEVDRVVNGWMATAMVGAKLLHTYDAVLNGIVIQRVSMNVLKLIMQDSRVLYVEEVRVVH